LQKFKVKFSLRKKFLLMVTILIVFIMSIVTVVTYIRSKNSIVSELKYFGKLVTDSLAERCKDPLLSNKFPTVRAYVSDLIKKDERVRKIILFDDTGVCIAAMSKKCVNGNNPFELKDLINKKMNSTAVINVLTKGKHFHKTRRYIEIGVPIQVESLFNKAKKIIRGGVIINFSLDNMYREINKTLVQLLILMFVAIALGFFVSIFLSGIIIKPVNEILKGARRVSTGDFSYKIKVMTSDELGVFAHTFNVMTENVSLLYNVSSAMNFINDSEKLLNLILDKAIEAIIAERGSLMLLDDKTDELMLRVVRGLKEELPKKNVILKIGEGIAGRVVETNQPMLVNEGHLDPRFKHFKESAERERKVRSMVCVPLTIADKAFGVINIVNKLTPDAQFDESDLKLLQALAAQAAVAINNAKLYELAITDGLTKLYIHRYFQARLEEEIVRARRYGSKLSLVMFDIDHFKSFNDTYGHQQGDIVLVEVAKLIKNTIRSNIDIAARYGGEEFAIVLPETDSEGARIFAERLRKTVEAHKVPGQKEYLQVTISLGVSTYPDHAKERLLLIKKADDALYASKEGGRNRVTVYSGENTENPAEQTDTS